MVCQTRRAKLVLMSIDVELKKKRLYVQMVLSEVVAAVPQLSDSVGGLDAAMKITQRSFTSKRGQGRRPPRAITWERLRSADASLEQEVWKLAQSYGYSR